MKKEEHRELVIKMASLKCRIPNAYKLSISHMNDECGCLSQFLLHCVPHSLQRLFLHYHSSTPSFQCDLLRSELAEVVKRVSDFVFLHNLTMSGSTFEAIVKAASQARELIFYSCIIDSSGKLDLDGPDYK